MGNLLSRSKSFLNRNASTILTYLGGVGVVTTSVIVATDTIKALKRLDKAKNEKGEDLTKKEIVLTAAPAYIPSIVTGGATIACIFGANALNKRQQAALMSAYALLNNSFKEYKNKAEELYGEEATDLIREGIAKDKYAESNIAVSEDKKLFYDEFSGRYFESTLETVQRAEYCINHDLHVHGSVNLNNFYDLLGIPPIEGGDALGWSEGMCYEYYWKSWIDFVHEKVELDDGLECCIIVMSAEPFADYEYY